MELHNLKSTPGARKDKHRVGRGHAAGKGKQAGKGQSGQNKRKGHRMGFEGGQTPWFRRVPKIGFKNVNHLEYQVISLFDIANKFPNDEIITLEMIYNKKLARNKNLPIKLLANGNINKKYVISVNAVSQKAKELVEKQGGKVEVI